MPIYEYECRKCGRQTEGWQRFSDAPLTKCESCNGKLKKIISQNTFHLKGTGWYVTDYSSRGGCKNGKKKEPPATESKKTEKSSQSQSKDQSTGSSTKSES